MYELIKEAVKKDGHQVQHDKAFLNTLIKSHMSEELLTSCLWDYATIYKGHQLFSCYGIESLMLADVITETLKRQETQNVLV